MDSKLVGKALNSQDSMLAAYRHKFSEIHHEMEELRSQLSEEKLKLRRDKQIHMLENERDWYREELQKADTRLKKLEAENKKLRVEFEEASNDRKGLYSQMVGLKKENKTLTQLKEGGNRISESPAPTTTSKFEEKKMIKLATAQSQERLHRPIMCESAAGSTKNSYNVKLYEEMICSLKKQLENERKVSRTLKAEKVKEKIKDTELQDFFISCVEEAKKDILIRQKLNSGAVTLRTQSQRSKMFSPARENFVETFDVNNKEGIAATKDGGSNNNPEASGVPLTSFLSSDKRKVLEMVFGKEEFIDLLVQLMFPVQGSIKVKNPITELVTKTKEPKSSVDLKRLTVKKGRKKIKYVEYKPYGITQ